MINVPINPESVCEHTSLVSGPIYNRVQNRKSLPDLPKGKAWCLDCGADINEDPVHDPK